MRCWQHQAIDLQHDAAGGRGHGPVANLTYPSLPSDPANPPPLPDFFQVDNAPETIIPAAPQTVYERIYLYGDPFGGNACPVNSTVPNVLCTGGQYCPAPGLNFTCPAGNYCKPGSRQPSRCPMLTHCPEGSGMHAWMMQAALFPCKIAACRQGALPPSALFCFKAERSTCLPAPGHTQPSPVCPGVASYCWPAYWLLWPRALH